MKVKKDTVNRYDEDGNMTCRIEEEQTYIQEYNAESRSLHFGLLVSVKQDLRGACSDG